jgi:hypothetical protein
MKTTFQDMWPLLPPQYHAAVTPSDTVAVVPPTNAIQPGGAINSTTPPKCLVIGGAGNLVVSDLAGNVVTYAVVAGQRVDFRGFKLVKAATSATGIVAQW